MTKILYTLMALCLCATVAYAHPPSHRGYIIPKDQVTQETQLWLTRLFVLESGWDKRWKDRREHSLLAYIVRERYNIRVKADTSETFVKSLRQYSRGLREDRKTWTPKMMWVLALKAPVTHVEGKNEIVDSMEEPEYWPENLRWARYKRFYARTWINAGKWLHGRVGHPCPGAMHWGNEDDIPGGKMVRLKCSSKFRNIIYGIAGR